MQTRFFFCPAAGKNQTKKRARKQRGPLEKGKVQKFQMLFSSPRRRARKSAAICGAASQSGKVTR